MSDLNEEVNCTEPSLAYITLPKKFYMIAHKRKFKTTKHGPTSANKAELSTLEAAVCVLCKCSAMKQNGLT